MLKLPECVEFQGGSHPHCHHSYNNYCGFSLKKNINFEAPGDHNLPFNWGSSIKGGKVNCLYFSDWTAQREWLALLMCFTEWALFSSFPVCFLKPDVRITVCVAWVLDNRCFTFWKPTIVQTIMHKPICFDFLFSLFCSSFCCLFSLSLPALIVVRCTPVGESISPSICIKWHHNTTKVSQWNQTEPVWKIQTSKSMMINQRVKAAGKRFFFLGRNMILSQYRETGREMETEKVKWHDEFFILKGIKSLSESQVSHPLFTIHYLLYYQKHKQAETEHWRKADWIGFSYFFAQMMK